MIINNNIYIYPVHIKKVMFCSKCGNEINEGDIFCPTCGQQVKKTIESTTASNNVSDKKPIKEKNESNVWSVIIIISLIGLGIIYGPAFMDGFIDGMSPDAVSIDNSYYSDTSDYTAMSQEEKNIQICEQVVSDYYATHTYSENDVFDCDNMAQDLWNILETKGINAEIMIGNVDMTGSVSLKDINHAWVMAEVSPNSWLALEGTGGYVVYDNEQYYRGFAFNDPKNYRRFLELYTDWEYQSQEYENYRLYYNELVETYNDANYYQQLSMKSGMTVARNTLEDKERDYTKTNTELNALLEYG